MTHTKNDNNQNNDMYTYCTTNIQTTPKHTNTPQTQKITQTNEHKHKQHHNLADKPHAYPNNNTTQNIHSNTQYAVDFVGNDHHREYCYCTLLLALLLHSAASIATVYPTAGGYFH
jgi:hypothetical protein